MKRDPYKQGLTDGINRAKKVIKNDIKSIYGIMALIMIENGNTPEDAENMVLQIQARWNEIAAENVNIVDYLREKLPFELTQI